jgi:sterol desaturase/sphingolipid hydroxylase (fatty acid hydroxylase superfamily)
MKKMQELVSSLSVDFYKILILIFIAFLLQVLNHSNLTHLKINLELILKLLILPWAGNSNFESYKK